MTELEPKQKIELAKVLMEEFNEGDWTEIFTLTGNENFTRIHDRFLNDVHWGNESLKQGCIVAVNEILGAPENIQFIWEFDSIKGILKRRQPELHEAIRRIVENDLQKVVLQPVIQTPNQIFYSAMEEADKALKNGEPQNAIDRIHTAVHAHLQNLCNKNSILHSNEAITGLITKLRDFYKTKYNVDNNDSIVKIMIGAGTIFDGLNNLRNHKSMSHPKNTLLDSADALLAINISRTLITYLNDKL